ncbi:RDD family protein [Luteimonas sp. SX5]|uniref:RDD family protein n=1 Tax=Luteimonas galliterrae TaxID=2940486 RepID=A0ABT0MPA5_9GAMM|nr:RDD family protein [Luteimonas galliterrae]MCL1636124.1 RDD family protein [Luteimonas galliterrae]
MAEIAGPAGFWRRYAAWSLDAAIVAVPTLLLSANGFPTRLQALQAASATVVNLVAQRLTDALMQGGDLLRLAQRLADEPALRLAIDAMLACLRSLLTPPLLWFALFAAIYWIAFEASPWQATPGKRALRIRITDRDGAAPGWSRAALRHVAGALSWLTLNLGHALAAWTPQKRALHDFVAGTRVLVDEDANAALPAWAKAWIALQIAATLFSAAWLYLHLLGTLRTAVDSALY